jgi:hypothetical protein
VTERQAWLYLAKAAEEDIRDGHYSTTSGLCFKLDDLLYDINPDVFIRMSERLDSRVIRAQSRYDGYGWPRNEYGHRQRIAFCKRQVARIDRARRKR